MLLSARTESNQRCAKGTPSMNTSPQAGVHRRRPPGPPVYGGVSLWPLCNPRRAKSRPVSVLFSAHRGLLPSKFEGIYILTHTAWCLPTCLVRQVSGGLNLLTHKKVGATEMSLLPREFFTGAEAKRSFAQSFFAYFFLEKSRLLEEVHALDLDAAVLIRVDGEAAGVNFAGTLRLLIAPGQAAQKQVDGVLGADAQHRMSRPRHP